MWVLRDYLDQLVVIGGWVPALHQISGTVPAWRSAVSRTTELDVLVQPELPGSGRPSISDLLRQHGFEPVDSGPSFSIWQSKEREGAALEFLMPLRGPHRNIGRVGAVRGQEQLGAVELPDLEFLRQSAVRLPIEIRSPAGGLVRVDVNVPQLGAFLVSRGAIFQQRRGPAGKRKAGKDLLYIHDVLAGGSDVAAQVQRDVRTLVGESPAGRDYVAYAANHVTLGLRNNHSAIDEAALMLNEREGISIDGARAAIRGFLTDFMEMLREVLGE
ncbi:MAG: hypothetical protein HYW06_10120 [Gemmatimonadetes bacterium]|nr:hypothetical protein [Gemmatimonadota bacterium]